MLWELLFSNQGIWKVSIRGAAQKRPRHNVEVYQSMDDLVAHGLDILRLGQYLQSTKLHLNRIYKRNEQPIFKKKARSD